MSYGNYAPFYRGGYFNPMQSPIMPNVVENQTLTTTNDMVWVLNETEATGYPVAPNNSVTLWDKNKNTVYIKSVNMQGVPSMRVLDYTERTPESTTKTPENHVCQCGKDFVRKEDFNALQSKIEALQGELEELKAKPKSKNTKTTKVDVDDE